MPEGILGAIEQHAGLVDAIINDNNLLVVDNLQMPFVDGRRDQDLNLQDIKDFFDEDEDDFREMEEWREHAREAIETGLIVNNAPEEGDHLIVLNDGRQFTWNNETGLRQPPPRPRRGQRIIDADGRHMPGGFNQVQAKRMAPPIPARGRAKAPAKAKVYPPFGVNHKGYLFSRELELNERQMLAAFGYHSLLIKVPDLVYKEKEIPIDENEECVILLSELADHLAIQACKQHIPDFKIEDHSTEYQIVYKRYLKEISQFKRAING